MLRLDTVDGRNPAPVDRWLIPSFKGVLYIPGGAVFLPSTVGYLTKSLFDVGKVVKSWQFSFSMGGWNFKVRIWKIQRQGPN